jgi:hypothetical protein
MKALPPPPALPALPALSLAVPFQSSQWSPQVYLNRGIAVRGIVWQCRLQNREIRDHGRHTVRSIVRVNRVNNATTGPSYRLITVIESELSTVQRYSPCYEPCSTTAERRLRPFSSEMKISVRDADRTRRRIGSAASRETGVISLRDVSLHLALSVFN